jgi:hypothetical protein
MLELLLIILIIAALGGVGWGWHTGSVTMSNPLSIILIVVVILLVASLITPHLWPYPTIMAPPR